MTGFTSSNKAAKAKKQFSDKENREAKSSVKHARRQTASISEEEAKKKAVEIAMEEIKRKEKDRDNYIGKNDVLVRSSYKTCSYPDHKIRKITAIVMLLSLSGKVSEAKIDAFYCPTCNKYYILKDDFDSLRKRGGICCKIIEKPVKVTKVNEKEYYEQVEESIYHALGYSVDKQNGPSVKARRAVLDFIIDNGIRTQKQTIDYLGRRIRKNGRAKHMQDAKAEWKLDREYLMSDEHDKRKKIIVDSIIFERHMR